MERNERTSDGSGEDTQATVLRLRLIDGIARRLRPWGEHAWDERVLEAMRRVPRHEFMTGSTLDVAYRDEACPIGHGQTISQPTIVALMTNALRLSGRERVLEIGTGCGYQTAVLASLAAEIYSLELLEPLATRARLRLAEMGVKNVYLRVGDGYGGWPEHAPFDRIVVTAAPPELPAELAAQLAENGVLVMPVGEGEQSLMRFVKKDQVLVREELGAVRFVPMVRSR